MSPAIEDRVTNDTTAGYFRRIVPDMNSQRSRGATNGSATDSTSTQDVGSRNGGDYSGMSRAEKFEDEKRRIVESCFGKKDPDGACTSRHHSMHLLFHIYSGLVLLRLKILKLGY